MPLPNHHPFPGRTSPLLLGTLLLIIACRTFNIEENEFFVENDQRRPAVHFLTFAALTMLMTNNNFARGTAVVGGVMRLYRSTGALGFLLQTTSLGFALRRSWLAANLAEKLKNLPRP